MTKKILLLLTVFLFISQSHSQKELSKDYNIAISKPYKVIDGEKDYYVYGNKMMAIKQRGKNIFIQTFDTESLNELSRQEYVRKEILPKNAYPEGILQLKDKCYYFYSSWSGKKTKHERLYYFEIDIASGKIVEGEHKKIVDVDGYLAGSPFGFVTSLGIPFGVGGNKFDLLTSLDSTKILIQYRRKPTVKRDTKSTDVFGLHVFDSNLSPVWNNEFKMPYTERRMDVLDFALNSQGDAYILSKVYNDDSNKDKKKKKDKTANYKVELFKLDKNSAEINKTRIELEDRFINEVKLFESGKGTMYCAGYYNLGIRGKKKGQLFGKEEKKNNADGIVIYEFSFEGELLNKVSHAIPNEIINQYVSDRTVEKNKKKDAKEGLEFENLALRNLVISSDGSLVLIGEQYRIVVKTTQKSVYYYYLYQNILVSKVNADGSLGWMVKVPKNQVGRKGLGGMSYTYLHSKGNHHMIFLDNVKNIDLKLNEFPYKHSDGKGGYLTSYKINHESGALSKGSVFDTRSLSEDIKAYQFETNRIIKTAEDVFLVEVYKKKKEDVLIKVNIK